MKANEFVKKHGLAEVKILLTSPSHGFFFKEDFYKHYGFDIYEDLKRLVESHEIVEYIGNDLDGAKQVYVFTKDCVHIAMRDRMIPVIRLKQAIADVESCQ